MHSSLLVCLARVGLGVLLMVLGLSFGWGPQAEAVHEPAGVVPVDPYGGDFFQVGQGDNSGEHPGLAGCAAVLAV
jgi:hypothetical protein